LENGDADEDDDAPIDRSSHRGIQTWEESIGFILSVNFEARAKNPSKPNARGGRGRGGRGRGGRGSRESGS
jgi:hypothetical protein